ncbi:cytochrome b-c1 complex subunit 8 [Calliopsis andreniformis]|uniref:cytochrome b-c1 complex subunit 8 n=1 Tax=Calliopsis andreniformis TaxID=337506 RepID=UPI003FCD3600
MGLEMGDLPVRIRRVVYYALSPTEQKVWAKTVSHSLPNLFMRAMRALPSMTPGFLMTVWCVIWGEATFKRVHRKDPKLYENDT